MKIAGGDAKAASAASVALEARRRIDAMFKVDSKFDDMEPGGRKAARSWRTSGDGRGPSFP